MAASSCMKCGTHSFEMVECEPRKSNYKLNFVQCTSCGGVVGVMDYLNVGADLRRLSAAVKQIANTVGAHVDLPS